MGFTHTLILTIPDSADCRIQNVLDSSIYNNSYSPTNCILEVTPPGYDCPVIFNTSQGFNISLNASNLRIVQSNSNGNQPSIPDGIYHFKYSVDPNLQIFIEYDKFRVCKLMTKYREAIRKLFSQDIERYKKDIFDKKVDDLFQIYNRIQAAKYMIDDENYDKKNALSLYNEAFRLLKDYNNCERC